MKCDALCVALYNTAEGLTMKFDSTIDMLSKFDESESEVAFTESLGLDSTRTVVRACLLRDCTGVYANFDHDPDLNFLLTEDELVYAPHLTGQGAYTVCKVLTPNGEMFDQPEVSVEHLGVFDDFDAAYSAFISAIKSALNN